MIELDEMSSSLLRQRRNLIVTSLIVLFILFTEVEVSKINLFGIEVNTPNPDSLMIVLWIIWGYFLVRFYQYSRVESASGIVAEFMKMVDSMGARVLVDCIIKKHPEYKLVLEDYSFFFLQRKSFLKWDLPVMQYDSVKGEKIEVYREKVGLSLIFPPVFKAGWHVFMHTPRVTDYAFPYALAMVTIVYGVIQ